ncbi:hypothetical protein HPP92_015436 [Vanilla planifolia]|uniref:Uncharacterized protein n=1 Tax=Vanilla planifolia TaxID=51239 RepID=A0A835QPH5_VANPL|nr:hypothetical protein HPP92_015436 [Vanilla planifolia]
MAAITPGVLLKLLQSMNSDAKPLGEHRSAVLQVIGIIPAPPSAGADSGDYLWPSHGFYLQLSDSIHSTYVSLSDVDAHNVVSNRPQLGQLVHVDRLRFAIPVPFATGLRPIPSPRSHPFLGSPEPLIAVSTPSHAPGFVIQPASPSAVAETIMRRPIFVPKENLAPAPSNSSSDSTSSVSKAKRRFSSPAHRHSSPALAKTSSRPASPTVSGKVGSRAPSPVPSKCEVPGLVAAREENRKVAKEPAIVVPSRYRQPSPTARKVVNSPMGRRSLGSPGGRRLSGGLKLSPAFAEGGGKKKVGSTVAGISRVSDSLVASGLTLRKNWEDMPLNSDSTSRETTNGRSKSHVNDQAILKSQEALNRRNAAAIAAAEALEEALSTESILRSLSMFCNLSSSPNTGNPIPAINTFLDIYDDTMKGHQWLHPLCNSHRQNTCRCTFHEPNKLCKALG